MQSSSLATAARLLIWNSRILSCMGIDPMKVCDPLFGFTVAYMTYHCGGAVVMLIRKSDDWEYVATSLTENTFLAMSLVKITVFRLSRKSMNHFLTDIGNDFLDKSYRTEEEKEVFLVYNRNSQMFVYISVISILVGSSAYYCKMFFMSVDLVTVIENVTARYELGYRTLPIITVTDHMSYVFVCVYHVWIIPVCAFGYGGTDAFVLSMALHVCGQFAALSCRIRNVFDEPNDTFQEIKMIVVRHHQLIKLAEVIEDRFNIISLQQILGTTMLLCFSCYNTITSSDTGDRAFLITFVVFAMCIMETIFAYCYIGECLSNESTNVGDALYESKWYNISTQCNKLVGISMVRAKRPSLLTAGKFCALSLSTFTDIVKTSMAYLSVLRNTSGN